MRKFRGDLNFCLKVLSHVLSEPREADMLRLKRFARYLQGTLGYGVWLPKKGAVDELQVWVDSDSAGD